MRQCAPGKWHRKHSLPAPIEATSFQHRSRLYIHPLNGELPRRIAEEISGLLLGRTGQQTIGGRFRVGQLRSDNSEIHDPANARRGRYADKIIGHKEARERALAAYRAAKS